MPMKAHSQRIENKNLREFFGMPLMFAVADTLYKTYRFENLIINTDSEEIKQSGPEVCKRIGSGGSWKSIGLYNIHFLLPVKPHSKRLTKKNIRLFRKYGLIINYKLQSLLL